MKAERATDQASREVTASGRTRRQPNIKEAEDLSIQEPYAEANAG